MLATFELGIAAQVTDWVEAMASLLYEEDDTDLEVDLAMITIANPEVTPVFFSAGQFYLPFGAYQTNLVSDPLTLEIGETRETAAQLGFVYQGFSGSAYAFNGDNKVNGDNHIDSWGANLAFAQEREDLVWTVGAGYINDLGDSDTCRTASPITAPRVSSRSRSCAPKRRSNSASTPPSAPAAGPRTSRCLPRLQSDRRVSLGHRAFRPGQPELQGQGRRACGLEHRAGLQL